MTPAAEEVRFPVPGGYLSGIRFGPDRGPGEPGVLLVHGTGHNAAAWTEVARHLHIRLPAVAVDLRGHGRSSADSVDAEQYWRDLASVITTLGWNRPVLVGHSTGGYAVTAAVAGGLVDASSVCIVDGFVLDDRVTAVEQLAQLRTPAALARLGSDLHYGWTGDEPRARQLVEATVRDAPGDWLNAGATAELVRAVATRSLVGRGSLWLRRPTLEEVVTVSTPAPRAPVFPSVETYDLLDVPTTLVLASRGLYSARRDDVAAIASARPGRRLIDLDANHNVPMTLPAVLARVIAEHLARTT